MKLTARLALLTAAAILPLTLSAATISGTVTDKTTGKPATGDVAVLLDLQSGMQESARATIDAKGHYSFNVSDTSGMHLVRVDHDRASYYGPVPPNTTTVNIDVYDVAAKVDGLRLYADVARMETDQQGLSVTESYFIRNESKPAKTQLSAHSFEFYLPENAVLEGATATGPGGMATSNQPVPMSDKGHYAFIFPIRPGETRFQVGYHVPYNGSAKLQARPTLATENIAIMLPKSMSFDGGKNFQTLGAEASGPGTQTFLATNAKPDAPIAFTVSGTGSMPREQQNPQAGAGGMGMGQGAPGQGAPAQGAAGMGGAPDQSGQPGAQQGPGGGLGNPIDTPDPLEKYKWWILSGVGLALVVGAAFMLRAKPGPAATLTPAEPSPLASSLPAGVKATAVRAQLAHAAPGTTPVVAVTNGVTQKATTTTGTLAALKEELFQLETERLEGKISDAEYAEHKSALEVLLKRALARESMAR
jgi:hypothetical protein